MDQRPWSIEYAHKSLPEPLGGTQWHVRQVRDFSSAGKEITERWVTLPIDTTHVTKGWYYVGSLKQLGFFANLFPHVFIGFELADGTNIAFSLEARRRKYELYDPFFKGMFGGYELTHLFTTYNDVVNFRVIQRGQSLDRYPITTSKEMLRDILEECLKETRSAALREKPIMYHTLTRQCGNILIEIINNAHQKQLPWHPYWHITGRSPQFLAARGILDLSKKETI